MSITMDPVSATTAARFPQNPFSWSTLSGAAAKPPAADEDLRAYNKLG